MVNGRIDKYQFEEGYCQAEKSSSDKNKDNFTFCYYDQDHLGNIRQVREADGSKKGEVIQAMNYYPFGAEFCDNSTKNYTQKHKYNGKEFDNMHGLNSYDYGARQYNPVTARWDRIDSLCEKYYSTSPYAYCLNNPVRFIDPDGKEVNQPQGGETLKKIGTWGMIGGALMMASATVYTVVTEGGGAALGGAQMFSAGSATFKAGLSTYTAGVAVDAARESVSRPAPVDVNNSTINAGKKSVDSGKNERHGDGGRTKNRPSTTKQINELQAKIDQAKGSEKKKLEQKLRNIRRTAQLKERGVEHSRGNKR